MFTYIEEVFAVYFYSDRMVLVYSLYTVVETYGETFVMINEYETVLVREIPLDNEPASAIMEASRQSNLSLAA